MGINYDLPKPTADTPRSTSPTETEILTDVSDTIADAGSRLDTLESATYRADDTPIELTPGAFAPTFGSPSLTTGAGGRVVVWSLGGSTDSAVAANMSVPDSWSTFTVRVHLFGLATPDGSLGLEVRLWSKATATSYATAADQSSVDTRTAPAIDTRSVEDFTGFTAPSTPLTLRIYRDADADTATVAVGIFMVELIKTS